MEISLRTIGKIMDVMYVYVYMYVTYACMYVCMCECTYEKTKGIGEEYW
jgi:hypothetical protein